MTEIEAARLADRLKRVWVWVFDGEAAPWGQREKRWVSCYRFFAGSDVSISGQFFDGEFRYISLFKGEEGAGSAHLYCNYDGEVSFFCARDMRMEPDNEDERQFAAQWLPFFRERCWLSGANIEATATEKMHWLTEARESGALTEDECRELALRETSCNTN